MAYLKGGTFVDGKLYVQDAIVVNKIQTPDGKNLPYINIENNFENNANNTSEGFVVGFSTNDGGLDNAPIRYSFETKPVAEGSTETKHVATHIAFVLGDYNSEDNNSSTLPTLDKIHFDNEDGTLQLDTGSRTWKFI